jgi:PKD repeat protein
MHRYITVFLVGLLAWAGLMGTDASGSAVVFGESWPGVDGSAWDGSRWVTSTSGTAVLDTQGGGGRIAISGRSGAGAVGVMPSVADAEVLVSFRFSEIATEAQSFHWLRGSGSWADFYNLIPDSGLGVHIKNTDSRVKVFLATGGGTRVVLANASIRDISTGVQWLRFRVEGNRILVKVWNQGQSEPTGWEIDVTSSGSSASGVYQIGFSRSAGDVARDAIFDDLTVTNLGGAPPNNPPTVSWSLPTSGDTVAGDVALRIEASDAEDPAGSLEVEWRVAGGPWQAATYDQSEGRYVATWDSTQFSDGTTTLEARVGDSGGASASSSLEVNVNNMNVRPTAIASSSCIQLVCSFSGSNSFDPDGSIVAFQWNFGDGSQSTGETANHGYAAAGTYEVTLEVVDNEDGIGQSSFPVTVSSSNNPVAFSEEWSGVDGSLWDASRWATAILKPAVMDVQGGGGHIRVEGRSAGGGISLMPTLTDAEVLVSFRFSEIVTEAQSFHWLRASGDWADLYNLIPNSGFGVQIKNTDSRVKVFLATGAGSRVAIANKVIREVSSDLQWVRFRVEGNRIMVKIWSQTEPEPSGWEIDFNYASGPSSGVYQIGYSRSGGSVIRDITFDNLMVTHLNS